MQIFIEGKELSDKHLASWKLKRLNRALKIYKMKRVTKIKDLNESIEKLTNAKIDCSYEQTLSILKKKLSFSTTMMKIAVKLSCRRKFSVTEIHVQGLTAKEISENLDKFMTTTSQENTKINLSARPEHYVLRPIGKNMLEVIETTGNSPMPVQFFISFGDEDSLSTPRDVSYEYQSVGVAKLKDGTVIGGVRHQFKNICGGCKAKLVVEFPSIMPNFFIRAHQMHLACEFSYWINFIADKNQFFRGK